MTGAAPTQAAAPDNDLTEYELARFHAARLEGLTKLEARRFAVGREPLQLLYRLRRGGCPPSLIAEIVR